MEFASKAGRSRLARAAMACALLALLVLLLTTAGWRYQEHQAVKAAGTAVAQAAAAFAEALEGYLLAKTHELELLAGQLGREEMPNTVFRQLAQGLAGPSGGYRWIVMVDRSGRVTATTEAERLGKDEAQSPWFEVLSHGVAATISAVSEEEAGVVAVAPMRDRLGESRGGVIGLIPLTGLEEVSDRLGRRLPLQSEVGTIEYQVLAPDGELLVDSELRQAGLLNLARLELPSALAVTSGASGSPGFIEELHLRRHVPVLTGYARLNHPTPYAVLLRIDRSNVVAPIRSRVWAYGGPTFMFLLVVGGVLRAWDRLRRPTPSAASREHAMADQVPASREPARLQGDGSSPGQKQDEAGQNRNENVLRRCREMDEVMARAIERLVNSGSAGRSAWLRHTIEALGAASGASRLMLFQYVAGPHGLVPDGPDRREASGRIIRSHGWTQERSESKPGGNQTDSAFEAWQARLSRGELVSGRVVDLSGPACDRLGAEGVQSTVAVPVFVRQDWWGFLRFDQCDRPRDWTSVELDALRAAARVLGAALYFQHREHQLQRGLCLVERTFDSADKGVVLMDADGQIVGFNRKFVELWNLPETVAVSRDHDQTLAYLLTQVKTPELFLRAMGELAATPQADSYDIVELLDGRVFERMSQPEVVGRDGVSRIWTFTDMTHAPVPETSPNRLRMTVTAECEPVTTQEPEAQDAAERLRALSLRLESVREQERRRLAREIHDQLGQALTGLKLDLAWLGGKLAKDYEAFQTKAQAMSEVVSQTIQTVRRISTELRPPILDDLGLPAAIEWQAHEFEARAGVSCRVDISPGLDLDEPRATAVFRIFQEILTNVARHANASAVEVVLRKSETYQGGQGGPVGEESDHVVLKVRDNGRGIDDREIHDPRSMGLSGMRERATMLGGRVSVRGIPGEGTTVTVHIPMEKSP
jgi:signal transduction histidine kinase